jgi:hypothetical protein
MDFAKLLAADQADLTLNSGIGLPDFAGIGPRAEPLPFVDSLDDDRLRPEMADRTTRRTRWHFARRDRD